MIDYNRYRRWSATVKWVLTGMLGVAALLQHISIASGADDCSTSGKACTFEISENYGNYVQKVPTLLKLQAQISQAKIPLGDAVFENLTVVVWSKTTPLCSEPFKQVRVRSGVLNLEIGRAISCQLDEVVAQHNDLSFQICIGASAGATGSCLKPIQMSSVPYAMKASFASQALESHRAEMASRSNYAQRITADGNMLESQQLGAGYYDFQTPSDADLMALLTEFPRWSSDIRGGFIQWAPTDTANGFINISGRNVNNTVLTRLAGLVVHANMTTLIGSLRVSGTQTFNDRATFSSGLAATGITSTFGAGVNIVGGELTVQAPASFGTGVSSTAVTFNAGATLDATQATSVILPAATFTAATSTIKVASGAMVDMSAAGQVVLPNAFRSPPAVTTDEYSKTDASGCQIVEAAAGKVFCGITLSAQKSTLGSCTIGKNTSGNYVLQACKAACSMTCF